MSKAVRKKIRRNVARAVAHIKATFNNTTVTITDLNGDTRTVMTRFVEQAGPSKGSGGSGGHLRLVIRCQVQRHGMIKCVVTFKRSSGMHGKVQLRLAHGTVRAAGTPRSSPA